MTFHLFFLTITLEKRAPKTVDREAFMREIEGKRTNPSAQDDFNLGLYSYLERW
ncbi:YrzI family small protein [Bacillus luteolus]|uniref:YrzI family small protein n=1 Tax=Litchfieldia luteola TaxID=682179 RepID=A0ABR9QHS9_9BACI|nr:YrzI family small protein [Cytobacillus luteolus]MBE4908065.1 YrzI family small protein [Cytobacillus luteolus]MBP1942849.1 uncharacterized protein (TIGR02413 family) [Cytobacillus luteolus]